MKKILSATALGLALLLASLLPGCGGSQVAGVGSGGSGLAGGTVSGYGSVYVDGVEIDDSQSFNLSENADGSTTTVALKLGQRVGVQHGSDGRAIRIMVEPALVGTVTQVHATGLSMLGQQVVANTDPANGPLTVFGGGYLALSDVVPGDAAEVHGSRDALGSIVATRIEKLSSLQQLVLTGLVARRDAASPAFTIGGLQVRFDPASVTPSEAQLGDGAFVRIWAPALAVQGAVLSATRIRIAPPALDTAQAGAKVQYAGVVSGHASMGSTLRIEGVLVRLASATVVSPSAMALGNGVYARVDGVMNADGSLAATAVQVRQDGAADASGRVILSGPIGTLLNAKSFVVRSVAVDASSIDVAKACPGTALAPGVQVEVEALQQVGTDVVKAVTLSCLNSNAIAQSATREARGHVSIVNTGARTLTLAMEGGGTQAVQWDEKTAFLGAGPQALLGTEIIVVGYAGAANVLIAREIRSPGEQEADRFDPANGQTAWDQYDNQFRPEGDAPPPSPATPPATTSPPGSAAMGAPTATAGPAFVPGRR
ncbi:MAG TPA: DUF5666 domain-containing protein [Burkholderiaceae bacterium]|nr:DUF5666 domain-containing protein [Burkholderiaceae bacterium]